ncbi:GNAT family N-acetyltransferase [Paeniroseomonas aquatica]|uniref:GNAT family N-acetyltransferase n=1 Tax=Paeniroseomonas aquatica TaxID=373043 RepID=A0ABT8AB94_9PROT|nr:GNAT family N-acetyltransferase [Paeniroseomonas aquatica]MDN3566803.1 GNAT family N-acetyltransferase [Paeniroseomonas aquatica]
MSGPATELPHVIPAHLSVERVAELDDHDIAELCEATDAAIIEGGGFGWVEPQGRAALERHFRGVMLVPERELFVARLDGMVVGSAQLVRPHRNNEAQAFAAQLTHAYIAPYGRGHGLARLMIQRVEERAAALGHRVLNLDVRETQATAIALFETLGYVRWGEHPAYARVRGQTVAGAYYYKLIEPGRGRRTGQMVSGQVVS